MKLHSISVCLGPQTGADDMLTSVRIEPVRKIGNRTYCRSLHPEESHNEVLQLEEGEDAHVTATFTLAGVDEQCSEHKDWGYATVANTAYTWMQIPSMGGRAQAYHLFNLARQLDKAYAHLAMCVRTAKGTTGGMGIGQRSVRFEAVGFAESMLLPLNRALTMIRETGENDVLGEVYPKIQGPFIEVQENVRLVRNAFEHIDDRIKDLEQAKAFLNQDDLYQSGVIRCLDWGGNPLKLDLMKDALPAFEVRPAVRHAGFGCNRRDGHHALCCAARRQF